MRFGLSCLVWACYKVELLEKEEIDPRELMLKDLKCRVPGPGANPQK